MQDVVTSVGGNVGRITASDQVSILGVDFTTRENEGSERFFEFSDLTWAKLNNFFTIGFFLLLLLISFHISPSSDPFILTLNPNP